VPDELCIVDLKAKDPFFRAKGFEVLMWRRVEGVERSFATALMDCGDDIDAFGTRSGYTGLGPDFSDLGSRASSDNDPDYCKHSPYDRTRAIQVALHGKNDAIRYYLINQVVYPENAATWVGFVKLLQNPPNREWAEMLVRRFAFWRYGKPTPKIEYAVVKGIRQVTNMTQLVDFYTKEYLTTHQ
jgi:hypothetical protein